jgi:8-oxo-dGTP diphosphatase
MGKSTRTPIQAAGGIVIRNGPKQLIAVVQRRRDDAWVLPKGKLKANEKPIAAARREATEETGCDVRVHEFLGLISYVGGNGPKVAHFWRMQTSHAGGGKLMDDIKAVEWLPLSGAIDRLSLPHEQFFLHHVGRQALKRSAQKARAKRLKGVHVDVTAQTVTIAPDAAGVQRSKSQPRWAVLARLTKRLQAALGPMRSSP